MNRLQPEDLQVSTDTHKNQNFTDLCLLKTEKQKVYFTFRKTDWWNRLIDQQFLEHETGQNNVVKGDHMVL